MKNKKKLIIGIFFIGISLLTFNNTKTIIIQNKEYKSTVCDGSQEDNANVSLYELAMLTSLAYEDVPNDNNYDSKSNNYYLNGCFDSRNNFNNSNCKFTYYNDYFTRGKFKVQKYVEGLSARKAGLMTTASFSPIEDGEKYYLLDYSTTSKVGCWKIDNYESKSTGIIHNTAIFDVITFKKGNNYVIAYRGTDFPDVAEWIQDILYAFKSTHKQANDAYEYAKKEYERITKSNSNAKVYVIGHSLGGYLAQVGGAAIVDYDRKNGKESNSQLEKVAYFNGMGISAFYANLLKEDVRDYIDDLYYLASHTKDGKKVAENDFKLGRTNYDTGSSGRLVLYQMRNDPVSSLGVHLGEIVTLEPAIDSISYHDGSHKVSSTLTNAGDYFANRQSASDLKEFLKNSIKAILSGIVRVGETVVDAAVSLQKSTTELISNIAELANEEEYVGISELNEQLPEKVKKALWSKTLHSLGDVLKEVVSNTEMNERKLNIIELANVSHETDSFICLNDEIPTISSSLYGGSGYGTSTGTNTTYIYYKNKNTLNNITLYADVTNGCARSYNWYKNDTLLGNEKGNTEVVLNNIDDNEIYRLDVEYGNTFTPKVLNSSGNDYNELNKIGSYSTISKYFKFVKDTVAPEIWISPYSTNLSLKSVSGLRDKDTVTASIEISDDKSLAFDPIVSVSVKRKKGSVFYGSYSDHSYNKDGYLNLTFKGSTQDGTNTYEANIKVKDMAGNIAEKTITFTVTAS